MPESESRVCVIDTSLSFSSIIEFLSSGALTSHKAGANEESLRRALARSQQRRD
jgi:hypothetical protein